MCSRYPLTSEPEEVRTFFAHHNQESYPPRANIAPSEPILVVRHDLQKRRELALVRWGLVPAWVKDPKGFPLLINARAETALEKPSFRASIAHHRCVIPANGFYEWSGPKGARQAHLIAREDNGLLAFAGLWAHWLGEDGSEFQSATILTVAANKTVEPIHDRMPALLETQDIEPWLNCEEVNAKTAKTLLQPARDNLLQVTELPKDDSSPLKRRKSSLRQKDASNLSPRPTEKNNDNQGELF